MKIRMRLFGLVAVLVLTACTKPQPDPAASVEEPQLEPQAAPEPVTQPVTVEPGGYGRMLRSQMAASDDPAVRLINCKLRNELQNQIDDTKKTLANLRIKYGEQYPDVIRVRRDLDALVQMGLAQCVERLQVDSPGHI